MSVAAKIEPGPGLARVLEHLADVRSSADTDVRHAGSRTLLLLALRAWREAAEADRDHLNDAHAAGVDVVASFRQPLPGPNATGQSQAEHSKARNLLVECGWLISPVTTRQHVLFRCTRGDVIATMGRVR